MNIEDSVKCEVLGQLTSLLDTNHEHHLVAAELAVTYLEYCFKMKPPANIPQLEEID